MMKHLLLILSSLSVVASIYIENWRIDRVHGKVPNVRKDVTVNIAIALFFVGVIINTIVVHRFEPFLIAVSGLFTVSFRYLIYDPWLNLLQNEHIDYVSEKTNSKTDGIERRKNIPFWTQRLIGLAGSILFAYLYYLLQ